MYSVGFMTSSNAAEPCFYDAFEETNLCDVLTWKELKRRSQKRRMRRSMEPLGTDSSITKVKRMAWIPNRGMRVRVDFANLGRKKSITLIMRKQKCLSLLIVFIQYSTELFLSPELVVSVSHLMSSEFRHQNFDNPDEYEEINLKWERKFSYMEENKQIKCGGFLDGTMLCGIWPGHIHTNCDLVQNPLWWQRTFIITALKLVALQVW